MIDCIDIFRNTLNKFAPLRKQTSKKKRLKTKPWITWDILKSIQHKNNVQKQCFKQLNSELCQSYKQYRNRVVHLKEITKQEYFQKVISENKQKITQLWKAINQMLNNNRMKG